MAKEDRIIEDTLSAMSENWFLGTLEGPKRAQFLRDAIRKRADLNALENALSLGNYAVHTQANKEKRHVKRAFLLANFVLNNSPLSMKDTLLKRIDSMPIRTLIQAVKSAMPAFPERDGKRTTWNPNNFSDPLGCVDLHKPNDWTKKSLPPFKLLIHAMPESKAKLAGENRVFKTHWERIGHGRFRPVVDALESAPEILTNPTGKLRSRLAISASVVGEKSCAPYANLGLILKVPATNILTTSPEDQWFDNRAGTAQSRDGAINPKEMAELIMHTGWTIGDLMSPDEMLALTGSGDFTRIAPDGKSGLHNEVVVCGKPWLPMGAGNSGELHVTGMFLVTDMTGKVYDGKVPHQRIKKSSKKNIQDAARRLNVPLLYLPWIA